MPPMFGTSNPQNTSSNTFGNSSSQFHFGYTGNVFHNVPTTNAGATPGTNTVAKELTIALPEDALESCKCNYCNCYVSVGPVRMVDNKVACGRCRRESDGVRLMIVEALAKQFDFPCRFKNFGCTAILKWVLVDSHEKVCDYKEIHCTVADCDWSGAKSSLKLHFEQKHACEIIHSQKGITVNLQEKKTSNFLYTSRKRVFLISLSNDGEKIYHDVKFFCTSLEACMFVYDICVYDSEKKLLFLNQKLQCFDDDMAALNAGLSIPILQTVFTNSNNVNISFQIKYGNKEMTSFSIQNIECTVCFEPMFGNIIVGQCGHSVCEQCKKSLQNCPCCRGDFFTNTSRNKPMKVVNTEVRNYSMEALIKKLSLDL